MGVMLSMNLKKILIIAIAILTICTSLFFGIHWLRGNRAREVVFGFLNTVVSQPDIVYKTIYTRIMREASPYRISV